MKTSKFLFSVGALSAVILMLQVQAAPDNPEQAKMREALRQLMESNSPQGGSAPVVPPAPVPAPAAVRAPAPTAAPVVPAPAQATTKFGPVPPPSQPGVAAVVPVAPPAPPAQPTFVSAPTPDDAASLERARQLMRQQLQDLQAAPPSIAAVPTSTAYTAIQVPPSPLSPAQQTKLADLLVRYKADTITAQDYHAQRAAILAGN